MQGAENKTGQFHKETGPFADMVRLAGFEPTTPWFVAKYSIQLSYSRLKHSDQLRKVIKPSSITHFKRP